jgi:hypothetical protein
MNTFIRDETYYSEAYVDWSGEYSSENFGSHVIHTLSRNGETFQNPVLLRPTVSKIVSLTYRLAKHLVCLFSSHTGNSPHHVRNSMEFVLTLDSPQVNPHDIMVTFEVVSLFTRVPIKDTMDLLGLHFEEDILIFFRNVLTTACFSFNGHFYEQIDGVARGALLSPVIANFYMEDFGRRTFDLAPHKPISWFRYVVDNFVICPQGPN